MAIERQKRDKRGASGGQERGTGGASDEEGGGGLFAFYKSK
jgi:hypothetical protein